MSEIIYDPFAEPPAKRRIPQHNHQNLSQLNVEDELLRQYNAANQLLADAAYEEIPLNQKAQAMNSIVAILGQIIRQQETVKNMAAMTELETALVDTLKEFPEIRERFLEVYEGKLLKQEAELIPLAEPNPFEDV
jgi:hypothetical protein